MTKCYGLGAGLTLDAARARDAEGEGEGGFTLAKMRGLGGEGQGAQGPRTQAGSAKLSAAPIPQGGGGEFALALTPGTYALERGSGTGLMHLVRVSEAGERDSVAQLPEAEYRMEDTEGAAVLYRMPPHDLGGSGPVGDFVQTSSPAEMARVASRLYP